jgi:NTP pyrophosphatase (non-canonical NTP hydrolase)
MKGEPETTIPFRMNIITYEWGNAIHSLLSMLRFPDEHKAHLENAKLEIGDMLVQLDKLCLALDIDQKEARELGYRHLRERYAEFSKRGWNKA